ncbi:MAG: Smr domain [Bacillota bacterium]|nr:Smr domain [Bacillota bacterium]
MGTHEGKRRSGHRGKQTHVDLERDLHGLTRAEGLAALQETVDVLRRRGGGRARIIHGCGEVLSEMVYDFARRTSGVDAVQERDNAGAAILEVRTPVGEPASRRADRPTSRSRWPRPR